MRNKYLSDWLSGLLKVKQQQQQDKQTKKNLSCPTLFFPSVTLFKMEPYKII